MKDLIQIPFILIVLGMAFTKPDDWKENQEPPTEVEVTAAIRKEEATITIDTVYIQSAETTAEVSPNIHNNGYLYSFFCILTLLGAWYSYDWWGKPKKPKKTGYKPPYDIITRHFVAAKSYKVVDEEGREHEETMIITKDTEKQVTEGRNPILTDLDVYFVLLAFAKYGKESVEQLPIHAIEQAKRKWAEGLGANRIAKLNIGMSRSYIVASISGFNAALNYAAGEEQKQKNQNT